MTFTLRPLKFEDIHQVEEIEKEAFPTLWPRTPFKRDLSDSRMRCLVVSKPLPSPGMDGQPKAASEATEAPPRESTWGRLIKSVRKRTPSEGQAMDAKPKDCPLGYVSIWVMVDEAHITSIAVRATWRGLGLGELLVIGALEIAIQRRSRVSTLEARVSNHVAIPLYEKYGFKRVGIRKGYFTDNREDAVLMTTEPIDTLAYQTKFKELQQSYRQRHGTIEVMLG